MSYFTSYSDYIREPQEHFHKPRLLFEGDSWFSIPSIANIPVQLDSMADLSILCLADPGDTLEELTRGRQFELLKYIIHDDKKGVKWDGICLSAGGNDVIGPEISDLLVPISAEAKKPESCLDLRKVDAMLDRVQKMLERLIQMRNRSKANSTTPIFIHTYSYLTPRWKAHKLLAWKVSGPWIVPYMEEKGIQECALQQAIVKYLLDRFHNMLVKLASAKDSHLVVIDTREALRGVKCNDRDEGDPYWYDEIHPTSMGYSKLVREYFLPALKKANSI